MGVAGLAASAGLPDPGPRWEPAKLGVPAMDWFRRETFFKFRTAYLDISSYVDAKALRHRPAGTPAVDWVVAGQVACARYSKVVHPISGARRAEGVAAQLQAAWPGAGFDPQRPAVKAYLAHVSRELKRGDTLAYVYDPSGKVHLSQNGEPWITLEDPQLVRALVKVAFLRADPAEATAVARALESLAPAPGR